MSNAAVKQRDSFHPQGQPAARTAIFDSAAPVAQAGFSCLESHPHITWNLICNQIGNRVALFPSLARTNLRLRGAFEVAQGKLAPVQRLTVQAAMMLTASELSSTTQAGTLPTTRQCPRTTPAHSICSMPTSDLGTYVCAKARPSPKVPCLNLS